MMYQQSPQCKHKRSDMQSTNMATIRNHNNQIPHPSFKLKKNERNKESSDSYTTIRDHKINIPADEVEIKLNSSYLSDNTSVNQR